jgi:hypothetical protein
VACVTQLGAVFPPGPGETRALPGGIITHPAIAAIDMADVPFHPGGRVLSIVRPAVKCDQAVDSLRFSIAVSLDFLGIWIISLLSNYFMFVVRG